MQTIIRLSRVLLLIIARLTQYEKETDFVY